MCALTFRKISKRVFSESKLVGRISKFDAKTSKCEFRPTKSPKKWGDNKIKVREGL